MLITKSKSRFNTFVNISRVQTKDEARKDFRFRLRMLSTISSLSNPDGNAFFGEISFDFPNNTDSTHHNRGKIFSASSDQNKRIKLLVSKSKAINKIRCLVFGFSIYQTTFWKFDGILLTAVSCVYAVSGSPLGFIYVIHETILET